MTDLEEGQEYSSQFQHSWDAHQGDNIYNPDKHSLETVWNSLRDIINQMKQLEIEGGSAIQLLLENQKVLTSDVFRLNEKCEKMAKSLEEIQRKFKIYNEISKSETFPLPVPVPAPVQKKSEPSESLTVLTADAAKTRVLTDIGRFISPDLAGVWALLYQNIEKQLSVISAVKSWSCDEEGNFALQLIRDISLGIEARNEKGELDPPGGLVMLFDRVIRGRLEKQTKTIEFSSGLNVYCRPQETGGIGVTPSLLSMQFINHDDLRLKAGVIFLQQKLGRDKTTTISKLATQWSTGEIILDPVKFIDQKLRDEKLKRV